MIDRSEEVVALDDLLDQVDALASAYGDDLLAELEPWLEDARELSISQERSGRDIRRVRTAIEDTLLAAACREADALLLRHAHAIDELVARAGLIGFMPGDIAVVIVDPRSPDIPAALRARAWPVHLETRSKLARELAEIAPTTAAALELPPSAIEQDVVVCTLGRVMRTRRTLRPYGAV